jgi:hypothetical protein
MFYSFIQIFDRQVLGVSLSHFFKVTKTFGKVEEVICELLERVRLKKDR